jgi:hypothetical protein
MLWLDGVVGQNPPELSQLSNPIAATSDRPQLGRVQLGNHSAANPRFSGVTQSGHRTYSSTESPSPIRRMAHGAFPAARPFMAATCCSAHPAFIPTKRSYGGRTRTRYRNARSRWPRPPKAATTWPSTKALRTRLVGALNDLRTPSARWRRWRARSVFVRCHRSVAGQGGGRG